MDDERYESDVSSTDSLDYFTFRDGLAVAVERCPLCMRSRRPFYCKDCVNTGNFSRTSGESERYSHLQQKLTAVTAERSELVERIRQRVAAKEERAAKRDEIEEIKTRIRLLKWTIKAARKEKKVSTRLYGSRQEINKQNAEVLQLSHDSVPGMQARYDSSREKLQRKKNELKERNSALKRERCRVINDLIACIFPVVELTAEGATGLGLDDGSMLMMSTARALSEACQLAYMSGQWVHTDCYGNTLIKIVESTLPGNGDYSAGVTSQRQELASLAEDNQRYTATNPTYAVISGLCFTTQLLESLSCVLHVRLPRKISYSTFGCNDFSEKQLQQAVSQLNHNMLHLCFSQGVDESSLISRHTMHNLLLLLRSEHLGEELAFTDSPHMLEVVNDGCESEDDSDKDETDSPLEWDFVNRVDLPEVSMPVQATTSWTYSTAAYAGHMLSETQSTASDLVTSAAASVASLWRTATGSRPSSS